MIQQNFKYLDVTFKILRRPKGMPQICNQKCSKFKLKIYFLVKSFFVDLIISNTFHNYWNKLLKSTFTRQEINKVFDDVVKTFVDFLMSK